MDSEHDWAEVLRSFRQRNNLKQEAAASLLGVSQAYVSKVENGAVQPSESLLKRLNLLNRQPQHRPTLGLIRAAVRHAPSLTCLFSQSGSDIVIEESSRAFYRAGHPFDLYPRADKLDFKIMCSNARKALKAIIAAGAFEGRFGYIEAVWGTPPREDHDTRYFRTIFLPLRTDEGDWLLKANNIQISEADLHSAEAAWGGPIRFFEHDEEPPYSWP